MILLLLTGLFAAERLCYLRTSGFMYQKIVSDLPPSPVFAVPSPSLEEHEEFVKTCKEPFTFLGNGHECYAFVSRDQGYVLKLFKHQYLRLTFLKRALLSISKCPFWLGVKNERRERLDRTFTSCHLAYTCLKEETGIVAMNLTRLGTTGQRATIIDRLGIAHSVDLDKTEYILQRKACPVKIHLDSLMQQGNIDLAKQSLSSLITIIKKRARLDLIDRDPRILDNFGYIGNRAIEIDTGSYIRCPGFPWQKALLSDTLDFETWLKKNYPELLDHFQEKIYETVSH